jgi:hypothetical protein
MTADVTPPLVVYFSQKAVACRSSMLVDHYSDKTQVKTMLYYIDYITIMEENETREIRYCALITLV